MPHMTLRVSKKPKTDKTVTLATLNEIAARASERFSAARARKLAKSKDSGCFSKQLVASGWKEAFSGAHEGHPCVFTAKDIIILKRHLCTIQSAGTDAFQYMGWVVASWSKIMATRFSWMTNTKPAYPAVRFMVKFSDEFQSAYAKRQDIERLANMTARERLVARRVERGMDEESAMRDVEEASGQAQNLQQVQNPFDETRERVARMRRPKVAPNIVRRKPQTEGTFQKWED